MARLRYMICPKAKDAILQKRHVVCCQSYICRLSTGGCQQFAHAIVRSVYGGYAHRLSNWARGLKQSMRCPDALGASKRGRVVIGIPVRYERPALFVHWGGAVSVSVSLCLGGCRPMLWGVAQSLKVLENFLFGDIHAPTGSGTESVSSSGISHIGVQCSTFEEIVTFVLHVVKRVIIVISYNLC